MGVLDFHLGKIDEYLNLAKENPQDKMILENGYNFIKEIAPRYYINGVMSSDYSKLLSKLKVLEGRILQKNNILDFHYNFNFFDSPSKEDVFDYIIWQVRRSLLTDNPSCSVEVIEDLYYWGFEDLCYLGSRKVMDLCKKFKIECYSVEIVPGYAPLKVVPTSFLRHYFNIIKYGDKYYLIDTTLAQFFYEKYNHPGKLGVAGLEGPSVGCYMMRLNKGEEIARKLFTSGYIELDEEVFKTYMDSFTLSFRNGLYYEENDIILPYSVDDYIAFLGGRDNQVRREKIRCLGRQGRPLKNPNVSVFDRL